MIETVIKLGLVVTNTFADCNLDHEHLMVTRRNWNGQGAEEQIDFVLASKCLKMAAASVEQYLTCDTDHRMVNCEFVIKAPIERTVHGIRCIKNWQPDPNWEAKANAKLETWASSWTEAAELLRTTANACNVKKMKTEDQELSDMLKAKHTVQPEEKKDLYKRIWRRRRHLKKVKHLEELQQAAAAGRAPPEPRPSMHLSWGKIMGSSGILPKMLLTNYFAELYGLPKEEAVSEAMARQCIVGRWLSLRIDMTRSAFNAACFDKALAKLKRGKCSPDGITAEMLQALPPVPKAAMAKDMVRRCAFLDFPAEWSESSAILVPKVAGASELGKFRPIACLTTLRKLLGYMWLSALPALTFKTAQTAFIGGSHACMGVHVIQRIAELAREWRQPVCIAQVDLKKAFDHVRHSAAMEAMQQQGISPQAQAIMAQLWQQSTIKARLGAETSEAVPLHRGLPQGAPESPLIFTIIVEMLLRRLEATWRARGWGFIIDDLKAFSVCYADDIILIAADKEHLELMIQDLVKAFGDIGLTFGAQKTHWTSMPAMENTKLKVENCEVEWESTIVFVGTVLDLTGSSAATIQYRINQGNKVYYKWRPILVAKWLPLARRADLLFKAVWTSALWCAATWNATQAKRATLDSWGARMMATVAGVKRYPEEEINSWWRRLHREGHRRILKFGTKLSVMSKLLVHRWGGHIARMPPSHFVAAAVRCRGMQWWRWRQGQHTDKWCGPHPQRFKASRWEEQLSKVYGDGCSELTAENTGWLLTAQDRISWKALEHTFTA